MTVPQVVDASVCPVCGAATRVELLAQPAIVKHGGYGATRVTSTRHCTRCSWSITTATDEVAPTREDCP